MQQTFASLIKLQQIDSQIYEITKIKDTFYSRVQSIQTKIDEQSLLFNAKKGELDVLQQERKAKEQLLQGEQDKLRKWERRLMESKNPREAAPLAREIDAQKRLNTEAQEELLRLMNDEERLSKESKEFEDNLRVLHEEFSKENELCQEKTKDFEAQYQKFETDRDQYTKQVRSSILHKYETIKKRREGLAIVPAKDGCCTGCNMRLRPQLYNIVQKVQSLETCPSCQRILYWEEGLGRGTFS